MDCYKLNFTISSPGNSTEFVEFSSNSRYLAVGDRNSLYILDRLTGFHPTISTIAPAKPTALVWESPKTFYVGLSDGRFIHYQIDLRGKRLVKGYTNNRFRGGIPITAIALDMESETLVLSLGPEVFAFRRVRATSKFYSTMNQNSKLTWVEANSTSPEISQTVSNSKKLPENESLRFRDPFVSPPTTSSLLRLISNT